MTGGHSFLGIFDRGSLKWGVTHSCDTGTIAAAMQTHLDTGDSQ